MEDIEKELSKERKIVHQNRKFLRVKPVIWIQRYLWIVLVFSFLLITTLLGVYNIKDIVLLNKDAEYIKEGKVRGMVEEYMSKNFFLVNPEEVEEKILENTYVKNVEVEKIFPNKLGIDIEEYMPFIIFETNDAKCKIFSQEGVYLELKEETDCEAFADSEDIIYFIGESTQIVLEEGKEYFYLADDINDISKILNEFDINILTVNTNGNILEISTNTVSVVMDTNQDMKTELARLLIVLKELKSLNTKADSIDVRFERPVIQIDK